WIDGVGCHWGTTYSQINRHDRGSLAIPSGEDKVVSLLWTRVARLDVLCPGALRHEETQSCAQRRLQEHTPLIVWQRTRTRVACVTHPLPPFFGCSSSRGSRYIMGRSPLSRAEGSRTIPQVPCLALSMSIICSIIPTRHLVPLRRTPDARVTRLSAFSPRASHTCPRRHALPILSDDGGVRGQKAENDIVLDTV